MMFYNGFNLGIDILLAVTVWFFSYRSGKISGFIEGYGAGEQGTHDWYTSQLEPPLDDMEDYQTWNEAQKSTPPF
jgi:hypothetical protein